MFAWSAHSSCRSWETRGVRRSPEADVVAGDGLPAPLLDELAVEEDDNDETARGLKLLAE